MNIWTKNHRNPVASSTSAKSLARVTAMRVTGATILKHSKTMSILSLLRLAPSMFSDWEGFDGEGSGGGGLKKDANK